MGKLPITLTMVKGLITAGLGRQAGLPLIEEEVLAVTGLAKGLDPTGVRPRRLAGLTVVGTEPAVKPRPIGPAMGHAETVEVIATEIGPSSVIGPVIGRNTT